MSKPINLIRVFYLALLVSSLLFWLGQAHLMNQNMFGILGGAYLMNVVFAAAVFTVIYSLKDSHPERLGFVFLAGSGLKFLIFFLFIYPVFNADGDMSNEEFAIFFIPYALTTTLETWLLVKELNRS